MIRSSADIYQYNMCHVCRIVLFLYHWNTLPFSGYPKLTLLAPLAILLCFVAPFNSVCNSDSPEFLTVTRRLGKNKACKAMPGRDERNRRRDVVNRIKSRKQRSWGCMTTICRHLAGNNMNR